VGSVKTANAVSSYATGGLRQDRHRRRIGVHSPPSVDEWVPAD